MNRVGYLRGYMQKLGTANFNDFCPQFLSPVFVAELSLFVSVRSFGDRTGTEWGQNGDKKISMTFSEEGSSEKLPYRGFHAILHDDVHEKLTAFPSMSCHCIIKNMFSIMTPSMPVILQLSS